MTPFNLLDAAARELALARANVKLAQKSKNQSFRDSCMRFALEHWDKAFLLLNNFQPPRSH